MAGGRPTEYREEYVEQVEKLCKLGLIDKEIADFFEVEESTINNWKLSHPEFLEAIKKGKTLADANVANRLYQRAMGYTHDAVKIFPTGGETEDSEGNKVKGPLLVPYQEHYPPDTVAAIFWLKNRQRKKWRDKVETGFTDGDGNDVPVTIFQLPNNGRSQTEDNTATGRVSDENMQQSG
jgi:hypothetical protein